MIVLIYYFYSLSFSIMMMIEDLLHDISFLSDNTDDVSNIN